MPSSRTALAALLLTVVALVASACGGSDGPSDVTSEELFAAGDDALDLSVKPPVDAAYLVPVDELIVTDLVVGDGDVAESGSSVSMQYVGVLADGGTEFDASWNRGQPLSFDLDTGRVIPGWDEGIQGMQVGGRRVLQIPAAQAYGDASPSPAIPSNSDLVFIVDLISVSPPPEPAPPVPEDALGSFDELNVIDLVEGEGRAIEKGDIVAVHYVGVTADDGTQFDDSWGRGETFRLVAGVGGVIEGWQDGLLGAQVGTERILQIPSAQAYGQGDLVFRVHVEEVIEGPDIHQLEFGGPVPDDAETTTLVEGSGDGAEEGDVVNARVVVYRHSDSEMLSSTYRDDSVTPLFLAPDGVIPGLFEGMVGLQAGETRQIIVPGEVAFPDGIPENSGLSGPGDALVFVVEAVSITNLDDE
ncbi:MAG: FKBP-type peptidyl-prolyl cis-trans isomerase [Actinomycetota bacterium]